MADAADLRRPGRLPGALLAYAVALAAFLLIPPTLKPTVGPPTAFTLQEAVDLLTPLAVLPIAWLVLEIAGGLGGWRTVAFVAIAAVWAQAQGLHLGSNAIGDAFVAGPPRDAFYATEAGDLDHFLDEGLSHWLWHLAWAALSIVMLWAGAGKRAWPTGAGGWISGAAGLIHGLTFFFVTAEGETSALGIPLSLVLLAWGGREALRGSTNPLVRFFLVSSIATLLADLAWAALHGWQLVEPCSVLHC